MKRSELNNRQDILVESDQSVLEIMDREEKKLHGPDNIKNADRTDLRFQIRKTLIEKTKSDPNGYERIIGESQLLSVNFLSRGIKPAKAVCRIRMPTHGGESVVVDHDRKFAMLTAVNIYGTMAIYLFSGTMPNPRNLNYEYN